MVILQGILLMKIEYLFPEHCNLFADQANVKYLSQCLPDATIIRTYFTEQPLFLTEKVDLVYMGAMTEQMQIQVIEKLKPYKQKIVELIESGMPFLITSNAIEVFGKYIETDENVKIEALGIFDFYAKQDMKNRKNSLVFGDFNGIKIVGFKTQFSMAFADHFAHPFIQVRKGLAMNNAANIEGVHWHNFFGTYLVGPFLVLNPLFTKYLLSLMGVKEPKLAYESVAMDAYNQRLLEFENPKTKY